MAWNYDNPKNCGRYICAVSNPCDDMMVHFETLYWDEDANDWRMWDDEWDLVPIYPHDDVIAWMPCVMTEEEFFSDNNRKEIKKEEVEKIGKESVVTVGDIIGLIVAQEIRIVSYEYNWILDTKKRTYEEEKDICPWFYSFPVKEIHPFNGHKDVPIIVSIYI